MKKLEKLTLKELSREVATIGFEEAQEINGGYTELEMDNMMAAGTWTGGQVDGMGYVGGVVTVIGSDSSTTSCPACERFHKTNEQQPSGDGSPLTTPIGEFLLNTLPHMMGWGDHTGSH